MYVCLHLSVSHSIYLSMSAFWSVCLVFFCLWTILVVVCCSFPSFAFIFCSRSQLCESNLLPWPLSHHWQFDLCLTSCLNLDYVSTREEYHVHQLKALERLHCVISQTCQTKQIVIILNGINDSCQHKTTLATLTQLNLVIHVLKFLNGLRVYSCEDAFPCKAVWKFYHRITTLNRPHLVQLFFLEEEVW